MATREKEYKEILLLGFITCKTLNCKALRTTREKEYKEILLLGFKVKPLTF
jgi:hypothetical protein